MSDSTYIDKTVARVISKIEIKSGRLTNHYYESGLFTNNNNISKLAWPIMPELIQKSIFLSSPKIINDEVWYADKPLSFSKPALFQEYVEYTHKCLPCWVKKFQYELLSTLLSESSRGWTTELFFSKNYGASLGLHCDSDDVYTIQLCGQKLWTIDPLDISWFKECVHNEKLIRINNSTSWVINPIKEKISFKKPISILLSPGDFLAIPAFALHKVESMSHNLSFSCNLSICQLDEFI